MVNFEIMSSEDTNKCIELVADSLQDYEYFSLHITYDIKRKKFINYILKSDAWIKMEYKAKEPCLQLKNQTWYVNSLNVRKDLQGPGIGTDIIQNGIISFVKQHGGKEICLFTNSEINRKFYNKNGFNEFHHQEFSYNNKSIGSWSYKKDI